MQFSVAAMTLWPTGCAIRGFGITKTQIDISRSLYQPPSMPAQKVARRLSELREPGEDFFRVNFDG